MASVGKIILGSGVAAGIIWFVSSLLGKKKLGDKLDTITLANVHSLDSKGLIIRVDVVLKNPTEYAIQIKQPYVRLLVGTDLIGSSNIKNEVIDIKPYSSIPLKTPIYVTIPLSKLLTLGGSFYQAVIKKQPVTITVNTLSSINLGSKWVGYDKSDPITLKPNLPALKPKLPVKQKPNVKH